MLFTEAIAIFSNLKEGNSFYIKYKSNLEKSLKATIRKSGHTVTKVTEKMLVRYNSYEDQPTVQELVANGYQLTHKRKWGEWDTDYNGVVNHKGNKYFRMYYPNDEQVVGKVNVNETHWFIDGVEVTKQEVIDSGYVNPSYWTNSSLNCIEINVDNILAIEP